MTTGLLASQIGYDDNDEIRLLWRADTETPPPPLAVDGARLPWSPLGPRWQSWWWEATLPPSSHGVRMATAGDFSEAIHSGPDLLWEQTWRTVSFECLERRTHIAKNGFGWLDCGSHWQEANSHACCLLGLLDIIEFKGHAITAAERARVEEQIRVGCDLLERYQDMAATKHGEHGALVHEMPVHVDWIVPADVSKAAAVFARAARLTADDTKKHDWRSRAMAACAWLETADPPGPLGFCHEAHGVPAETPVPKDFMTRDLLMELWAVTELARAAGDPLPARAATLAERVLARQFDARPDGVTLDGQFATFDGWPRPEPAWTHFLGKGAIGNDVGATYPHWLVPFLRIATWWPDHPLVPRLRASVERFAYGYFLPACQANPFRILPLGEFPGQGPIWFAGLWHGMTSTYGLAAALALEFERFLGDPAFHPVATGNLQWTAGLNGGIHPGIEIGCDMSTPHTIPGRFLPVSLIYGVGRRSFGSWKTISGSIASAFMTGRSFHFDVPPRKDHDSPATFSDEEWITFNGAWLAGTARHSAWHPTA